MTQALRRNLRRLLVGIIALGVLGLPSVPASAAQTARVPQRSFSGVVLDSAGRPVAGADVEVWTDESASQGLACLLAGLTLVLAPVAWWVLHCEETTASATTGRDGRFVLHVPGDGLLARDDLHHVRVTGPRGARFSGDVHVTRRTRAFPEVTLWTVPATISRTDGRAAFSFLRPRGSAGRLIWSLRSVDGGQPAWSLAVPSGTTGTAVDERVLEHGTRSGDGTVDGRWAGHPARWWSASIRVPAVAAPPTRGAGCSSYDTTGALRAFPSCPWTDGRLGTEVGLQGLLALSSDRPLCFSTSQCEAPGALVLDLGQLRWLDAVVWRGCTSCELELSVDARHWQSWHGQQQEGGADAVLTGDPAIARYVRVHGMTLGLAFLREVSVWSSELTDPPAPAPPSLSQPLERLLPPVGRLTPPAGLEPSR